MSTTTIEQQENPIITDVPAVTPTLLCVDDEQNVLSALRRLLHRAGYTLLFADNGRDALTILGQQPVDLIISDMRMPEMSGAELLAQVASSWPDTMRILLTGYSDINSTVDAINKGKIFRYISKPWNDDEILHVIEQALEVRKLKQDRDRLFELTGMQNTELKQLNENLEARVEERTAELNKAHISLKNSYTAAIKIFSGLIELRERSLAGHSRRVAELARQIGESMKLDPEECQQLLFAGLLHDMGKIGLADNLYTKPYNLLNDAQKAVIHKHPVIGEMFLMSLEPLHTAAKYIRHHHERYDGKGYPDGLKGKDIPLGARILAVANDFDSLQLGTVYSMKMSAKEARDYIRGNRLKLYDPDVIEAFLPIVGEIHVKPVRAGICMSSGDLKPGMTLTHDLMTDDGVMLLAKDHVLDEFFIQKIRQFEKSMSTAFEIYVRVPPPGNP